MWGKVREKIIALMARTLGLLSSLCCVVLGKLLITFAYQFPHQPNGANNRTSEHCCGGSVEIMCERFVLCKALYEVSLGFDFIPLIAPRQNLINVKKLILL